MKKSPTSDGPSKRKSTDEDQRTLAEVPREGAAVGEGEVEDEPDPTLAHAQERKGDVYDRFSRRRKYAIVGIVAYSALLAPFASSSFLPSIPTISNDLSCSGDVINYTVAIYLVTIGVAPLAWAPYARFYGRKPIYLVSLPLFCVGSMGVALSQSLVQLIVTRILQGIGASSVLSVGAGSIGDIYRPTERGRAMGLMYGGALFGPALAPLVAGLLTQYVANGYGWRAMQWLLCAMGGLAAGLVLFLLPETAHSRGVVAELEKRKREGKRSRFVWVWLDPIKPVWLLRYKNVLVISIVSSVVLETTYAILVPLTYTIGPRYSITSVAVLGLLYLAPGVGNLIGSRVAGIQSDQAVKHSLRLRNGIFHPEDRLRATLIGSGIILPVTVLAYGIVVQFWMGPGGLAVALILIAASGFGLMTILAICNTYLVDSMQTRSTEVIAINNCLRYVACAASSSYCLPLTNAIGVAPMNAISSVLAWIGFALIAWTIRDGSKWREDQERKEGVKMMVEEGVKIENEGKGDRETEKEGNAEPEKKEEV
ncbi:MFS general substrate transporter [Dacryopinax primogenitus]|uniref:MFS general substrate transporter n=1 Tax=Dacryopinax primogenitus (strain DJM 731) TaxID=1858805 RepID=M5GE69_DACPD|nr:MFS general substrate transporter [Dacryopinax primogenitus]EJU03028.1 MFS general substrate transporter [Dacryopinax primogenitus]